MKDDGNSTGYISNSTVDESKQIIKQLSWNLLTTKRSSRCPTPTFYSSWVSCTGCSTTSLICKYKIHILLLLIQYNTLLPSSEDTNSHTLLLSSDDKKQYTVTNIWGYKKQYIAIVIWGYKKQYNTPLLSSVVGMLSGSQLPRVWSQVWFSNPRTHIFSNMTFLYSMQ